MNNLTVETEGAALVEAAPEQPNASVSLLQVIQQAATNPDVDIEKMERLMAMHERMVSEQARQAFNTAMIEAQEAMGPVRADADNKQTRSKYASYAGLDKALRPIYTKHGFAVSFTTGTDAPENHVRVIANVMHRDGHTEHHPLDMPADGKGAKGGDVMTKTHAAGSAISYGRRYLLLMVFNISVGDDDDGNRAGDSQEKITHDQMIELSDLADEVGADKEKFCRYGNVTSLSDILAKDFQTAKKLLESKRKPT